MPTVGTESCSIPDVLEALHGTQTFSLFQRKYMDVALALRIRSEDLPVLRRELGSNDSSLRYAVNTLLMHWVSNSGEEAKLSYLIEKLKDVGLTQCAESLETHFGINPVNTEEEEVDISNGEYCRPLQRCYKSLGVSCYERDTFLNLIINGVSHETLLQKDLNDCTFIHYLLRPGIGLTLDRFNQVVQCLIDQESTNVFNIQGWRYNSTPLHWLMCSLKLKRRTLKNLKRQNVNFKAKDHFKDNILAYAIDGKQSIKILYKLMSYGAEWEYVNNKGENLLHHAARCHYVEAGQLFRDHLRMEIDIVNTERQTPLLKTVS